MFEDFRRRLATSRVKPGDGRPLAPFRWWQILSRSLFFLRLDGASGSVVYAIDVRERERTFSDDDRGTAHLYRDGIHHARSKLPARFEIEGGAIEVAQSPFGLKRCHYVASDGSEVHLSPHEGSLIGRRARLDRTRPALSRAIGVLSILLLVGAGLLGLPQLLESMTAIPPVADLIGPFESPYHLSPVANVAIGLVAVIASTERATRLRHSLLLDGSS